MSWADDRFESLRLPLHPLAWRLDSSRAQQRLVCSSAAVCHTQVRSQAQFLQGAGSTQYSPSTHMNVLSPLRLSAQPAAISMVVLCAYDLMLVGKTLDIYYSIASESIQGFQGLGWRGSNDSHASWICMSIAHHNTMLSWGSNVFVVFKVVIFLAKSEPPNTSSLGRSQSSLKPDAPSTATLSHSRLLLFRSSPFHPLLSANTLIVRRNPPFIRTSRF